MQIWINRSENSIAFKIMIDYHLELLALETMKLLGSK